MLKSYVCTDENHVVKTASVKKYKVLYKLDVYIYGQNLSLAGRSSFIIIRAHDDRSSLQSIFWSSAFFLLLENLFDVHANKHWF